MNTQQLTLAIANRQTAKTRAIENFGFIAEIIFNSPLEGILYFFGEEDKTEFTRNYPSLDYNTAWELWKEYNKVMCWMSNLLNPYCSAASSQYDEMTIVNNL
jgi:hypothetical protein